VNGAIARAELARFGTLSYAGFFLLMWPFVLVWLLGEPGQALLDRPAALPLVIVLAAWPIPVYCFLEDPRTRIFELSLPIARRDLHLTRLAVLGAVMLAPIAGALCSTVTWLAVQGLPLAPVVGKAVDILGATILLAVACVTWQPTPDPAESLDVRLLQGAGLLLGVAVVLAPPPWIGIACALATAVVVPRFLWATPQASDETAQALLPPLEVVRPQAQSPAFEVVERPRRLRIPPLHWLLLRTTFLRASYLGAAATFLASCSMAVLSGPLMSVAVLPFVFFEAHASVVLRAFARLDGLPLRRSHIAVYLGVPSLLAMLVLAGLGTFRLPGWGLVRDEITLTREAPHVRVPAFAWRRHTGSEAPVTSAPWGEAIRGEVRRIPDADLALFNPYDVTQATSLRMLGWQLARAGREIYGVDVPPEKILGHIWAQDSAKTWNPNAQLQGSVGDLKFVQDISFRELFGPSRLVRFGMTLAWLTLLWGAGMLFTFASPTPPARRLQLWLRWTFVVPALLIALYALGIGVLTFWIGTEELGLLHGVLVDGRLHHTLGVNTLLWLLLDALAIGAILAFVLYRIRGSELGWIATGNRPGA